MRGGNKVIQRAFTIKNKLGLHARPAALFVQLTNKFSSEIFIQKDTKIINAKSIMGIMALGIARGEVITVKINGLDEEQAMKEIENLIEEKLLDQ
ncbi:HPr family phosphocarrier protein [Lutibacter sp. B2]|nr:HPr family phosphocarrier protein [Lutibacter sp. B2]